MTSHAREGHKAERKPRVIPTAAAADVPQSPLDFALAFMRDDSKPDALRVGIAKAALPYLHARPAPSAPEEAPQLPPPFDLPDPYGSLRHEWREALERAGLIPAEPAPESVFPPRTSQVGSTRLATLNNADVGQARHPSGRVPSADLGSTRDRSFTWPKSGETRLEHETGGVLHAPTPPPEGEGKERSQPRSRSAPSLRDDDASRIDPFDPHPGYRWI